LTSGADDDDDDDEDDAETLANLLPPAPIAADDHEQFFRGPSADTLMRRQRASPTADLKAD
jgi:hypothetical protein